MHVVPRARRTEIAGVHGDAIKIRVAAPPADGAANEELIRFIAERLGIARRAVEIGAGKAARDKIVVVTGMTSDVLRARLATSPRA